MATKAIEKKNLGNKFLIPIGRDSELYFDIINRFKKYIGGIYIGWPYAPSGRMHRYPSQEFFDSMFSWSVQNGKVFNILFNMEPHDFKLGFNFNRINLTPYGNNLTELTFSSILLLKEKVFEGFKKNISVNSKINTIQQIYELQKDNQDINAVCLDRDINRNQELVNRICDYAAKLNISIDLLANEGCMPFCPNKRDHNVYETLSHYSDQSIQVAKARKICIQVFSRDPSLILKSPFLTREVLNFYNCRFIKITDRSKPPAFLDSVLEYYVHGKSADLGVAFTVERLEVGLTTDMLPSFFHDRIINCKNECYHCNKCDVVMTDMLKKHG